MAKRTYINADEELIVRGKLILEGNIEQRQFVENIEFTQQDFAGDILVVNSDGTDANGNATTASIRLQSGNAYGSFSFTESANIIAADANISAPYFVGAISSADGLTSAVNIVLSTDATGSSSFQNAGDTATIPVTLATVNTDVGSFGDAATVPSFTVNGKGLITAANETAVNITASQVSDFETAAEALFSIGTNSGDGDLSYANGVFDYTGPTAAEAHAHFSATDAGGDGSFSYSNGVFTYTGPSASEVRAHLSAGTGLTYSGGQFSITNTAVSAGTYGTSNDVPQIAINAQGQITSASDVAIDHDALANFDADEHVAHSGVTLTAGAGLTGGGTIAVSRSFAVGQNADNSIIVNADDVQLNVSYARGLVDATDAGGDGSFSYNNSTGIFTYTGPSASETRAHFSASNGVDYNSTTGAFQAVESEIQHDSLDGFVADEHVAHSGVTLTAGDGLSGGGDISASRSFAVDSTVVRTSGNQSIAGVKTFTGTVDLSGATVPGFTVTGNLEVTGNVNSLNYVDLQVQNSEIILNSNVSIAQDAFIKVERGGTGTDTYIKWDEGTDRWQFSNDGSTDNNMLLFSDFSAVDAGGDGSFSYANGVYTYTGPSAAETRAHFSANDAGGDGSFSYANGVFTYTGPSAAETRAHFSANDTGGDGSLSYSNGVFTYTGPSASEVRAHFSASNGVDYDSTTGAFQAVESEIQHDNLDGFIANEHVDHSSITLTAGSGLTGGGDITASRTFNIGAGTGITVAADSISTNDSAIVHDNLSGFVANEHVDHSGVTLTAGDGLSGGGDITASRSFAVDNTVIRTTGNQSLAGTKTFTDSIIVPDSATATTGAIYTDNANSKAYVYVGGQAVEITPAVDAGDVEAVGSGDINIYAGSRASGNTTIHGIKSISDSTYSTISEASNVITVDANITAIRGAFSAVDNAGDGTFSYNNATGVFSYSGVSQSQIRGEFSASGSTLSYDNSTGVFTSTADNYGSWELQTDSGSGSAETVSSAEKITIQGGTNITVTNVGNVVTVANDNTADITAVTAGTGLTGGGNSGAVSLAVDNSHVRGLISASGDISYDSSTGVISFSQASAPVTSVNTQTGAVVLDTDDVAEGTNKYYTDERVDDRVANLITAGVNVAKTYDDANGTLEIRVPYENIQDIVGAQLVTNGSHTGISFAYDDANDAAIDATVSLASFDTDDLSEGSTNLYYTNARADARADARVSNALSGDVTIGGNLTVSGTQTIINTETLTVDDNMIVLNNNEAGTPSQDAGIEIERGTSTNVKFQFKESTDRWQFTNDGSTYFNLPTSTADVAELTNLYFTNARARSALSVSGDLSYNSSTGVFSFTERTDAEVRGLISGTGLISYNNTTGVISTTADNYSSWTFQEGNGTETGTVSSGQTLQFEQGTGIQVEKTADRQLTITNTAPDQTVALTGSGSVSVSGTYPNFTISGTDTDTNTTYSAGTDLSLSGTTFNVDSATAATASTLAKRDGSGNLTANIFNGTATSARYADLAEIYSADASYDPGTVLVIGGNAEVTVTDEPGSYQAVGVVSTDPAYLMNSEANGVAVALRGRVPCKVAGVCKKGDVLITSDLPGHAMVAADPKSLSPLQIIGRALANKTEAAPGVVEILV